MVIARTYRVGACHRGPGTAAGFTEAVGRVVAVGVAGFAGEAGHVTEGVRLPVRGGPVEREGGCTSRVRQMGSEG